MNSTFISSYGYHVIPNYGVPLSPPCESLKDPFSIVSLSNALKANPNGTHRKPNNFPKYPTPLALKQNDVSSGRNIPWVPADPASALYKADAEEIYSRKVFVGGLPIDTKEATVSNIFSNFGKVMIDWPRRLDSKPDQLRPMAGYVFLVFEDESSVQRLINQCFMDQGSYWLFVTSDTMRDKPVQIRPWKLDDSDYMIDPEFMMDSRLTVFIGGVPRPTRAIEIADALNPIYGPIAYVGVDTDPELKYPKGCARVTFATSKGYIAALRQRHVDLSNTSDNSKRVEIKPYLMEEQMCDNCFGHKTNGQHAQYFCGFEHCLQYYCAKCWDHIHTPQSHNHHHRPTVRQGDQTKILDYVPHHPNQGRHNTRVMLKYGGYRG